jgi:hypothetical protein
VPCSALLLDEILGGAVIRAQRVAPATPHRRTHDDAPFGFVNIVEWESAAAWEAAHDDGFRALTAPANLPFVTYPTVCTPVAGAPKAVGDLIDSATGS